MLHSVSVVPVLLTAAVLIVSGAAKLRQPDDLAGWDSLGVPKSLQRSWLLKLHPWGEIGLGAVLLVFGGPIGTLASVGALGLMVAYLLLVVRAVRAGEDASCACFGTRKRVTAATIVRNSWYVLLAAAAAVTAGNNPLLGGPLRALEGAEWLWTVAIIAAVATVILTMWQAPAPASASAETPSAETTPVDEDLLDYVRTRTPAVPVTLADGSQITLRKLSSAEPVMLIALNPGCGPCQEAMEAIPRWREMLPEVSVRMLLMTEPDSSTWVEHTEPQSVHDPNWYVSESLDSHRTPAAVLLGADGLLAGGPVVGYQGISTFVDDIYESLHGRRPAESLDVS